MAWLIQPFVRGIPQQLCLGVPLGGVSLLQILRDSVRLKIELPSESAAKAASKSKEGSFLLDCIAKW